MGGWRHRPEMSADVVGAVCVWIVVVITTGIERDATALFVAVLARIEVLAWPIGLALAGGEALAVALFALFVVVAAAARAQAVVARGALVDVEALAARLCLAVVGALTRVESAVAGHGEPILCDERVWRKGSGMW